MYEFDVIIYHVCPSNYAVSLGSTSSYHVPTVCPTLCSQLSAVTPFYPDPCQALLSQGKLRHECQSARREAIKGITYYFNEIQLPKHLSFLYLIQCNSDVPFGQFYFFYSTCL